MTFICVHMSPLSISCQVGENEGDYWQWDEFSSSLQWTYRGPTSTLQPTERLLFFFSPLNVPVAFLKVPRDASGCGETQMSTGSIQSLHHPSAHMFMIRWAWHAQAFISFSMETLIWPAAACNLSILEFLKCVGEVKWHACQAPWKDMTLTLLKCVSPL